MTIVPVSKSPNPIVPISPVKLGSVGRQPHQCSIAKFMKQYGIDGLSGVSLSREERPSQRDVSSDVS